jgi:hypothetical protein
MTTAGKNENLENPERKMSQAAGNRSIGEKPQSDATASSLARTGTGPRTPMGKERSKYNALKHGIFSQVALLKNEPRAEFDALLDGFQEYFQPKGVPEQVLVEQLAVLKWRLRRLLTAEAEIISHPALDLNGGFSLGVKSESMLDHPNRLFRYEAGIERSFGRTLDQLERLQRIRLGQPVLPKLEVQHSVD